MMKQFDRSRVTGYRANPKGGWNRIAAEDFVHLRNQDPILIACRRNHELAGCDRYEVDTRHAFSRWVDDVIPGMTSWGRAAAVPEYEW